MKPNFLMLPMFALFVISQPAQAEIWDTTPAERDFVFRNPIIAYKINAASTVAWAKAATFVDDIKRDRADLIDYFVIDKEVIIDSKNNTMPKNNGDLSDAFRHIYWTALITIKVGEKSAKEFTDLHELGSPAKKATELNALSKMDLHNNAIGIAIGRNNPKATENALHGIVYNYLFLGGYERDGSLFGTNQYTGLPQKRPVVLSFSNQMRTNTPSKLKYLDFYPLDTSDLISPTPEEKASRVFNCIERGNPITYPSPTYTQQATQRDKTIAYFRKYNQLSRNSPAQYIISWVGNYYSGPENNYRFISTIQAAKDRNCKVSYW